MTRLTRPAFLLALVALLPCFTSVSASAQAGYLRAYSDPGGTSCDLQDPGGLVAVHVFHEFHFGGASASRFRLGTPPGWQYLTFETGLAHIGIPTTDLSVGYGECVTTKTYIGRAVYFSGAPAAACSQVEVLAAEIIGQILALDCSGNEVPIFGYGLVVNPTGSCCCLCLATEQRTWGSVKALYR